ncbi:MAG: VOC family protein [Microbacteriaceae bacterium]|nr:VOC family protein [Microbacteriaceae bacterium]
MTVSLSQSHILVDDPDAALAFYRDALGLQVVGDVANGGFRWITLVAPGSPEVGIVLEQPEAGRSAENGDALAALLAKGELSPAHFRAAELDATIEAIRATPGAVVLEEPADRFWGVRDAAMRDPAGNLLRIEQAK